MYETRAGEARQLIETALAAEPQLTAAGIGIEQSIVERHGGDHRAALISARTFLQKHPAFVSQVQRAADWIKQQHPIKQFNTKHTSYDHKRAVEDWWGSDWWGSAGGRADPYVANGSFIAAAIGLGWEARRVDYRSLNAYFKFSTKSLQQAKSTAPPRYL